MIPPPSCFVCSPLTASPLTHTSFEFESTRRRQVNHARNIWDRAVTILPRVPQFWQVSLSYKHRLARTRILSCLGMLGTSYGFLRKWQSAIMPPDMPEFFYSGSSTHIWRKCWAMWRGHGRFLSDGWSGSLTSKRGISISIWSCATTKSIGCVPAGRG